MRSDKPLAPGLHIVATPIGNLGDITLRAIETLAKADLIAAEDTRVAAKLLRHLGLETPVVPYHDHNAQTMRPHLIERLQGGATIALVSDAGTPLVSDPGLKLVQAALDAGIPVTAAPGPCAAIAALTLAGLPTDRFCFCGFLPPKSAARQTALADLAAIPATLLFYEGPSRLAAMLGDAAQVLGKREAAVARELTKLHEEVVRGDLADLAARYAMLEPPRGELVVLIGPPTAQPAASAQDVDALLTAALQTHRTKDAATLVAAQTGLPRASLYERALALKP
ncbi:16S rRNA (cytidine(1402)-2'-O)-methyltransferase [Hankyongella ginsenosidimutans]|uniref:Ribosomal RNA small subunit methyltransferase I n=1 Tax=Hankyongella ginsenosidimutans TaxID=1763828 RepID=A0A4D7BZW1_9SPHN|nr:16S rRNA (cytidine(1402)-2'-O)-methyltransferase [Hankyongella ginsenosidimutans]QCI78984.1 16S rRNA (cytidine(1402)-2'-O)-methyltransferase [Hankyongella ginsenosidimutans]